MNNTPTLNHWPIITSLDDIYVPEMAQDAMDCATEATAETIGTVIGLITLLARRDWEVRGN